MLVLWCGPGLTGCGLVLCRFLSAAEREQLGRLCKRLIDSGRLDFLKKKGFDGRLSAYVKSQVTLENVLLTAVPSSPS